MKRIKKVYLGLKTWFVGKFKKKSEKVELGVFTHDGKRLSEDTLAKAERILAGQLEKGK